MKKRNILTIIIFLFCVATSMAQNAENGKTGILLVHYGTSNDNSRMQTIDRLNARVAETFTDCAVVEAYKETGATDFQDVLTKLMPQVSFTPNAMGSYIRVNGLGNKYVLVLVNGKKMIGDIAGNVDLPRINMSKVKRIEVLDGAASALYGSDAIGGVINIITDENSMDNVAVSSDTRVSGKGQFS